MKLRNKILIVDDSELNRSLLADMLCDEYEIMEAENGLEALKLMERHHFELSLFLLDIVMPEMDGFEVLAMMNKNEWIERIPVIIISSEQVLEKEKSNLIMVEVLSHIVEFRNGESGMHVLTIRTITEMLLKQLCIRHAEYSYLQSEILLIANVSALHDIGKISIDEKILNKPARLTPEEYEIMKNHSLIGVDMLERMRHYPGDELVRNARDICRWHHERYDGKGYPDGLVGDEIPIEAQVVSLADVYDAMTHARVYKEAYPHKEALEMIFSGHCGAFNPLLLECLRDISPALQKELMLEEVARRLKHSVRNSDIVARMGGDEFLVFVEYTNEISPVVERVFRSLGGTYRGFASNASMGVALFPVHAMEYSDLFQSADQALYAAKHKGRNCYCMYDDSMDNFLSVLSEEISYEVDVR